MSGVLARITRGPIAGEEAIDVDRYVALSEPGFAATQGVLGVSWEGIAGRARLRLAGKWDVVRPAGASSRGVACGFSKFRDCTISLGRRLAMGEFSIYHWLIVLAIVIFLYGGRRIPDLMHGMGRGIKSFKDGLYGSDHSSEKKTPHEH